MNTPSETSRPPGIIIPILSFTFYAIASGYLMSLLPLLLSDYGLEPTLVSGLASTYFAGLLIGTIYSDKILKHWGHKKAFTVAMMMLTISVFFFPLFPNESVWLVIRLLEGIFVGGIFVFIESWLLFGDEKSRAKRLSIYMSALYIATALGQLGLSFSFSSPILPFIVMAVILALGVSVIVFGKTQQPAREEATSQNLRLSEIHKMNHSAMIGCTVSGIVLGVIYGILPSSLQDKQISSDDIGYLMALIILGAMVVQPLISMLTHLLGGTLLLALCCFLGASSVVLYTQSTSLLMISISLFALGMSAFSIYPVALNLGSRSLPSSLIASGTKMMLLVYSVGNVLGPLGVDWFENYDNGAMRFLFSVLLSTCLYMLLSSLRTKRRWALPK